MAGPVDGSSDITTVVLCGGRGTRAYPHTLELPKPLLPVAGVPVLRHVLEIYAQQGFTRFVLAAGYLAEKIDEFARTVPDSWDVGVVDTGEDTPTGARVRACRDRMTDTSFVTYGDGLGAVDLGALLEFHRSHAGCATLTTVPLRSPFGTVELDAAGAVERFVEKPVLPDRLINAGFFVLDDRAFESWDGTDLEREVLPGLASRRELFAYRHHGFWRSMDSYKDAVELTSLCAEGGVPWLPSTAPASS